MPTGRIPCSCSVLGVIEQEPTVARPAGRKMPQPGSFNNTCSSPSPEAAFS